MILEYDIYHINQHEAEFSFMKRGLWCQNNCKGNFEISVHSAHFELKEDYQAYGIEWIVEGFIV